MKQFLLPNSIGGNMLIPESLTKNNFDCIRFLLAAVVIFTHAYVIYYGAIADLEPFMIFSKNQEGFGGVAVDFFFVISGFLIVRSFEYSSSLYDYLVKRILRIIPGLLVAILASTFFFGVLGTVDATHKFGNWKAFINSLVPRWAIVHLFYLEAPSPAHTYATNPLPNNLNGPLWSIKYEFICYLLTPLLGIVGKLKRPLLALVFFLLCYIVLVLQTLKLITINDYNSNWMHIWPSILSRLFSFFLAGALFYYYRDKIIRHWMLALLCVVAVLLTSFVGQGFYIVLPLAGTYLVFYLAHHPHISFHDFAKRGDFSYGMYLYGWPVQQVIMYFFSADLSVLGSLFVSLPLTFVAAYLSWHFVESPALTLKKKKWWFTPEKSKQVRNEYTHVQVE